MLKSLNAVTSLMAASLFFAVAIEANNAEPATTTATVTVNSRTLQENNDIPYPEFRYRSWHYLAQNERAAAKALGYTQSTWDDPGLADIENKSFKDLTTVETSAAKKLGFDKSQWDCYQNHYGSYSWHQLKQEGIQEYFTVLGWTHETWKGGNGDANPNTEAEDWKEMTSNEQQAARKLCYFQETWNKVHFDDWECTKDHYGSYTWDELTEKGVNKYFEILGWSAATWSGAATRIVPESESMDWNELTSEQHIAARKICFHKTEWDGPPYPTFRYRKWDHLSYGEQKNAGILSYTEESWNKLGQAQIEESAFHELSSPEKEAAAALGFKKSVWDCYINHYEGFTWDALYTQGVQVYFIVLGFNSEIWGDGQDTNIDSIKWDTLNPAQKTAAKELCYIEESWDDIQLDKWDCDLDSFYRSSWSGLNEMGVQQYFVALGWGQDSWSSRRKDSSRDWEGLSKEEAAAARNLCFIKEEWNAPNEYYPIFRYSLWNTLDQDIREAATNLGYNEDSWNNPGTTGIEEHSFERLNNKMRNAAKDLGYSKGTWDCWQNHYFGYDWKKIEEDDLVQYFASFGWTETLWNTVGESPEQWDSDWSDLSSAQRNAAESLCYFEETWEKIDLNNWNCSATHYSDYDWSELKEEGVQSYLALLGWTEDNWNGNTAPPITEDKEWNALNQEERIASRQICYSKNLSNSAPEGGNDVNRVAIFFATVGLIVLAFATFRKLGKRIKRKKFDVPIEETVQV